MGSWEGIHIPPGQSSWWECSSQAVHGLFHVHLSDKVLDESWIENAGVYPRSSRRTVDRRLKHIASMLLKDAGGDGTASTLLWDSYAILLSRALGACGGASPFVVRGGLAPWQARRCIEYLHDHASANVGLEQLAALVSLSSYHFARAFRQTVGVPPHRYQLNLRIEKAKILLRTTQSPITEIAFDVGYESSQALARLFRREVGLSPSDYRRQCGGSA